MNIIKNIYKLFIQRHLLAAKWALILILVLEVVLVGRELLMKDRVDIDARVQQEATGGVLGVKEEDKAIESEKTEKPQSSPTTPTPKENKPVVEAAKRVPDAVDPPSPTPSPQKDFRYTDNGYFRYNLQPYLKEYTSKNVNVQKGTIKFKVTPDWGENSENNFKTLIIANFNGEDYRNLFEISGAQADLAFDTYDNAAFNGADEPNYFMGNDYLGKSFEVLFRWNFTGDPVKQIFINGQLEVETKPEAKPTETNSKIYIGPVEDLEIIEGWEE